MATQNIPPTISTAIHSINITDTTVVRNRPIVVVPIEIVVRFSEGAGTHNPVSSQPMISLPGNRRRPGLRTKLAIQLTSTPQITVSPKNVLPKTDSEIMVVHARREGPLVSKVIVNRPRADDIPL